MLTIGEAKVYECERALQILVCEAAALHVVGFVCIARRCGHHELEWTTDPRPPHPRLLRLEPFPLFDGSFFRLKVEKEPHPCRDE